METAHEKYLNNANYHKLVDAMVKMMIDSHFTEVEMMEAAMLASLIYEERKK